MKYLSFQNRFNSFQFSGKALLTFCSLVLLPLKASALDGFDIRTTSPLNDYQTTSNYTLSIADCVELRDIQIVNDGEISTYLPTESGRNSNHPKGCEFSFQLSGSTRFDPSITATYIDGHSVQYSESFILESAKPSISLENLAINFVDGEQFLVANLHANDNTDLSYVSVRLTGIRASDLRSSGGVIQKAKENAFLDAVDAVRIYPESDEQTNFQFAIKIQKPLSQSEIARNALAIVEGRAVDSSGNQHVISDIRYLGESVEEQINGFSAYPEHMLFTDILQSARIIPSVDYEFRGLTAIPGIGQGVSYSSSDPSSVIVTQDGIVYPVQETAGSSVDIVVSFPGQESVVIPVTVDFNRNLVGLEYEGHELGPFELPRLNRFFELPPLVAVFDDGSTAPLNDSQEVIYGIPNFASGILTYDADQGIKASALINAGNPLSIQAYLQLDPSIQVAIPVISNDAPPEVSFQLPARISVDETLSLKATVETRPPAVHRSR
ncbi:MAG: hypothetical protein P8101_05195 [Candidatus Thiodiazotropha sp.]